jgi:O-antigen/teichoic acid export membrane protein
MPIPAESSSITAPRGGIQARMTRAVAWSTVGATFNQGSTFVVNVAIAHLLTRQAFGHYGMIQSTLSVVAALAPLSAGYTATKFVAEYRDANPARAGRVLGLCAVISIGMGCVAGLALVVGAAPLAVLLRETALTPGLMIAGAIVFSSVMNAFLLGALAGFESYPAMGKAGIASGTLYLALCIGGVLAWGINGALAGAAVAGLAQSLILWRVVIAAAGRSGVRLDFAGARQETGVVYGFSLPAALNGFVSLPAIWGANAILARQPDGYDQIALFTAANSFRIIVLFLPNILNSVGMSLLNNQRGAGDEGRFRRLFWLNLAITGVILIAAAGAVVAAGPWLLSLFGEQFRPAQGVLVVLMAAALAEGLSLATFQVIQAQGRIWLSFFGVVAPSYLALVLVSAALAPAAGAIGLAWGYLACWCIAFVTIAIIARRIGVWSSPTAVRVVGA